MNDEIIASALERFETPFYLFDENVLQSTIAHLEDRLPYRTTLCYAMKANPLIVAQAARRVQRIEVCSPGELRICQLAHVGLDKVVISGVNKDAGLMLELMALEQPPCRFTVESVAQFDLLEHIAESLGAHVDVLLRLTSKNQFGVDMSCLRELADRALLSRHFTFRGIQLFSGTQKSSAKRIARELSMLDETMESLRRTYGLDLSELDIEYGPGLPVSYFAPDEEQAALRDDEVLTALSETLFDIWFPGNVVLELGRAIAGPCGTYVTSVVDTKRNASSNYAIVDGGRHQLVYFDQAMALQQPLCRPLTPRPAGPADSTWTVCGSLCTAADVLAKQLPLGALEPGDALAFLRTGAYCMCEGLSLLLSRDLPRILLATTTGDIIQLRNRVETYPLNAAHTDDTQPKEKGPVS